MQPDSIRQPKTTGRPRGATAAQSCYGMLRSRSQSAAVSRAIDSMFTVS